MKIPLVLVLLALASSKRFASTLGGFPMENIYSDLYQCDDQVQAEFEPFVVTGSASVGLPPERVIVSFGLSVLKKTAQEALQESANIIDKAVKKLVELGVNKDEDLSTLNLRINAKYSYPYDSQTQTTRTIFEGYEVFQTLLVDSENVEQAGNIIDGAINAGMNRVDSVQFDATNDTKSRMKEELVGKAIEDAQQKAGIAAESIGFRVTGIKDVRLNDYHESTPNGGSFEQAMGSDNVQSETQVLNYSVNVTFLLEKQ